MKAVILAAGRPGSSFPDNSKQKVLYHVDGEILLERLVRQLREAGIEDIRLVTGYGAERIENFTRERKLDLELVYNPDWDGDSVKSLRCGIRDLNDDALIVFGDTLANSQIFRRFLECKARLVWIKTLIPWGIIPDDEVYRGDRSICIVKVAKENLSIFEGEKADGYLTQIVNRCYPRISYGSRLNAILLEAMYRNGPVEEIVVPSPILDVDYYFQTDEGSQERYIY